MEIFQICPTSFSIYLLFLPRRIYEWEDLTKRIILYLNLLEFNKQSVQKCVHIAHQKRATRTHFARTIPNTFPHALPHAHETCGSAILRTCAPQPNICLVQTIHFSSILFSNSWFVVHLFSWFQSFTSCHNFCASENFLWITSIWQSFSFIFCHQEYSV